MHLSPQEIQRFEAKSSPIKNGCVIWTGYVDKTGYGKLTVRRKTLLAHRVSWLINFGEIPTGKGFHGTCVMHTCDNRRCVNPKHLRTGSQHDNMVDAKNKGRKWAGEMAGEKHPKAKLRASEVLYLKKLFASDKKYHIPSMAKELGVDRSTLYLIRRGEAWSSLTTN